MNRLTSGRMDDKLSDERTHGQTERQSDEEMRKRARLSLGILNRDNFFPLLEFPLKENRIYLTRVTGKETHLKG